MARKLTGYWKAIYIMDRKRPFLIKLACKSQYKQFGSFYSFAERYSTIKIEEKRKTKISSDTDHQPGKAKILSCNEIT